MQEITLGIAPPEEETVQLVKGTDYLPAMREQAKRFKTAIETRWPDLPDGCRFRIKTHQHDFGDYLDVVLEYPDDLDHGNLSYVVQLADAIGELKTWYELEKED